MALKHSEVQIITPHWILDCVESNKLLSTDKYHPSFLKSSPSPSQACNGALSSDPASSATLSMPISIDNSVLTGAVEAPASRAGTSEASNPHRRKSSSDRERSLLRQASQPVHGSEELSGEVVGRSSKFSTEEDEGERGAEMSAPHETSTCSSEKLLEGIVICFVDYQECVEDDTLEKWKLVRFRAKIIFIKDCREWDINSKLF